MFRVKVTYRTGYSDIGECDTEAQALEAVKAAEARMQSGEYGIDDVSYFEA
ncbi:MAG TPA: hypothetical protein VF060_24775 [Trebonia sp.]